MSTRDIEMSFLYTIMFLTVLQISLHFEQYVYGIFTKTIYKSSLTSLNFMIAVLHKRIRSITLLLFLPKIKCNLSFLLLLFECTTISEAYFLDKVIVSIFCSLVCNVRLMDTHKVSHSLVYHYA